MHDSVTDFDRFMYKDISETMPIILYVDIFGIKYKVKFWDCSYY